MYIYTPGDIDGHGCVHAAHLCVKVCNSHHHRKVTTIITRAEGESNRKTSGTTRAVVVTSGKGGVGKTTSSANLGMSMARLGYSVALVDADIGLRNLDLLLGLENRVVYTAMEVLEGECRLEQALIRDKRWRNLALLPISKNRQRYNVTRDNMTSHLIAGAQGAL